MIALKPMVGCVSGIACAPGLGDAERFERPKEIGVFLGRHHADEATKAQPGRERVGAGKRRTEQNQETVEKTVVLNEIAAVTASGTAPANSSFTKRCCTACDQPTSLAARRVSVKRSGMTSVPV